MIRRNYIEQSDVEGSSEPQIALAEAMIDAYVGPQEKALPRLIVGKVSSAIDHDIFDDHGNGNFSVSDNFYAGAVIEIIGGAGQGQTRQIVSSNQVAGSITFSGDPFIPAIDNTSIYKIYQLAKFPRRKDRQTYDNAYYATIPEAVRQATIAQTQYIMEMGEDYFVGDDSNFTSESIGNYSYSRGGGNGGPIGISTVISPIAKSYLRGYVKRTGTLIVDR